jgi:DNA-binding response OmpR family regulator
MVKEKPLILAIDDEINSLGLLSIKLKQDGFDVITASCGLEGMRMAYQHHPDLILLDIGMPGMDGYEVCRFLRSQTDAVIIFVSAWDQHGDVIQGLQVGGDDYLTKPYHYAELLARVNACLRRKTEYLSPRIQMAQGETIFFADPARRLVLVDGGRAVRLTPKEFDLLQYLVKNRGKVLGKEAILANVWGREYCGEPHLVKQFIYRLRCKLEQDPSNPIIILTIRGSGYLFEEQVIATRN